MKTRVIRAIDKKDIKCALNIRRKVFVEEQHVPEELEVDGHENECAHFLAVDEQGTPCGTARWRQTDNGIKLERFAVLKSHRNKGIGTYLVDSVLQDITKAFPQGTSPYLYLNAQVGAISLYEKFGFKKIGEMFTECGIQHFKMEKTT